MLHPGLAHRCVGTLEDGQAGAARAGGLAGGWWLLAVLALAASTVGAMVLVVARTPFLGLGAGFFRTALVLHVDLAVIVWFLAVPAGLWLTAVPPGSAWQAGLARGGLWLAVAGVAAMLLAPLGPGAVPVLANYVPLLDAPLFHGGLAAFMAGVGLVALATLSGSASQGLGQGNGWRAMLRAAMSAYWAALAVFLMALPAGAGEVSLDGRLWGGGHLLQIVHTLMLMAAWMRLGERALAELALPHAAVRWLIASELLAVAADLAIAIVFPVDSPAYRQGFTEVMRWATWPAPVCLAACLLAGYWRLARRARLTGGERALILSLGLFALGCVVGAGIRGETTAVPAHYHGTVGAVTLAYMLWGRALLADLRLYRPREGLWSWQPLIYGLGIALMVGGLAWAGSQGVARKAPHAEAAPAAGMASLAMGLAGVGGLLATAGAGIFVLGVATAIRGKRGD